MHYAVLLNQIGRYDDAIKQIQAALESDPKIHEGHDLLGNSLERAGHRAEALTEYRKAILLDPDSLKSHLDLGAVLAAEGNWGEASLHLRKAIASKDGNIRQIALRLLEDLPLRSH